MFADKRQDIIYKRIKKCGAVTSASLMEEFQVSVETIRRDLLALEKRGVLKRVHGGAVEASEMKQFFELDDRNKEFIKEKRELSIYAADFIEENDIIFVDTGSTAMYFAEVLKERFTKLTIITHSLNVFHALCNHKEFEVILCGGHFDKKEKAFYGSLVLDSLSKVHVQKIFIFPSSVSINYGICDYQEKFYLVQKKMLESSSEVFVLADSGKFERKALLKLDDMKKEYHYITDSNLSDELEKLYIDNEIHIHKGMHK